MSGKRTLAVVVCLLALVAFSPAAWAMDPGFWEITVTMKFDGMPAGMPVQTSKFSKCMTEEDAVPQEKNKNNDCKMLSQKISGNTVSWVMQCVDEKGTVVDSDGTVTYNGSSMDGKVNMTMQEKGSSQKMKLSQTMQGKRTGPCK